MKEVWIVIQTTEIWIPSEADDDGYWDDDDDRYEYSDEVIGVFSNEAAAKEYAERNDADYGLFVVLDAVPPAQLSASKC